MLKPTTTASELKFKGRVIDVSSERLKYSNGREYDIDFVRHPGAAAVVALDAQERLCVVRQYRHGIADFLMEIPAGKLDRGEAARDLRRARAHRGDRRHRAPLDLPRPVPPGSGHLHRGDPFVSRAGSRTREARPDADEELEIDWLPFAEALERVARGDWNDGKTAMALLRARHRLHSVKLR